MPCITGVDDKELSIISSAGSVVYQTSINIQNLNHTINVHKFIFRIEFHFQHRFVNIVEIVPHAEIFGIN